jgi:hypothetical protein
MAGRSDPSSRDAQARWLLNPSRDDPTQMACPNEGSLPRPSVTGRPRTVSGMKDAVGAALGREAGAA